MEALCHRVFAKTFHLPENAAFAIVEQKNANVCWQRLVPQGVAVVEKRQIASHQHQSLGLWHSHRKSHGCGNAALYAVDATVAPHIVARKEVGKANGSAVRIMDMRGVIAVVVLFFKCLHSRRLRVCRLIVDDMLVGFFQSIVP